MNKIKGYVGLCAIIIFNLVVLLFLIGIFFKVDTTIVAGVIGFVGAIIGGVITLFGVKQTIDYQIKRDRLEKLPGMIVDSWKIHNKITYIQGLRTTIETRPDINEVLVIEHFNNDNEDWMTELSAKIDPRMYNLVNSFFTLTSDYEVYKNRGKSKEWFEKLFNFYEESSRLVHLFEKEYEKYKLV
jgi:hypothetical protein